MSINLLIKIQKMFKLQFCLFLFLFKYILGDQDIIVNWYEICEEDPVSDEDKDCFKRIENLIIDESAFDYPPHCCLKVLIYKNSTEDKSCLLIYEDENIKLADITKNMIKNEYDSNIKDIILKCKDSGDGEQYLSQNKSSSIYLKLIFISFILLFLL